MPAGFEHGTAAVIHALCDELEEGGDGQQADEELEELRRSRQRLWLKVLEQGRVRSRLAIDGSGERLLHARE